MKKIQVAFSEHGLVANVRLETYEVSYGTAMQSLTRSFTRLRNSSLGVSCANRGKGTFMFLPIQVRERQAS